jgi:hypothetical protein
MSIIRVGKMNILLLLKKKKVGLLQGKKLIKRQITKGILRGKKNLQQ